MFGFGAVGVWDVGGGPFTQQINYVLVVNPATYTVATVAVSFAEVENISPASFVVAAQGVTEAELEAVSSASFAISPVAVSFSETWPIAATSYAIAPSAVPGGDAETVSPASFTITPTDVPMAWTGPGVDQQTYFGIGHYLEEIERARQLAKITRKTPQPIDRTTRPTFGPIGASPVAPFTAAPDPAAIANQRMAEQMRASAIARRRRNEAALLLLAS